MIEWTPIVFVTFKVLALGIGMFFAIKCTTIRGRKRKGELYYAQAA